MIKSVLFNRIFLLGVLATSLASCKKNFLDVNTDPNNPTNATVDLVLPTAQGYLAYNMGNSYQILGGLWGQIWTQGPTASQYRALDQYSVTSSSYDNQWISMYAGPLADFKYLVDEGARLNRKNYAAIGKIMQAYTFQYLADIHGDIPFSEALNPSIKNPKYDPQEQVYDGLIKLVDEGIALIDENSSDHPGEDDLFYHGDMHLWMKFANTLKLKIYLRQAYVRPAVAQAGVQALYAANAEFLDYQEDAEVHFSDEVFNQHPLFATYQALTSDNLLASQTALGFFLNNNDPRVDVFYRRATLAPNAGQHAGIAQGNGPLLPGNQNAGSYSKPGGAVGGPVGGEDAPVVLMSAAESYFLQAEAAVRGWGAGDAQDLYESGVIVSFLRWGLSQAQAETYLAQPAVAYPAGGAAEQKIRAIIFQKWAGMNGTQNLEAWTEWRRTGYPDIYTYSATTIIGNRFPARILYPDSEVSRNPNTPAQKTVTDKVWWDVNTTGQN